MTSVKSAARTRHWTDLIAIITGVTLLAFAIWPGTRSGSAEATQELGSANYAWIAWICSGALSLAAVLLSGRVSRTVSRAMLLVAGAVLLIGYFIAGDMTSARSVTMLLLPAAVLIATSFGVGPMPRNVEAPTARDGLR